MHSKRHPFAPAIAALFCALLTAPGCAKLPKDDPESHSPDARIRAPPRLSHYSL